MTRLSFLHEDNAANLALLREQTMLIPSELVDRVAGLGNAQSSDEESALTMNMHLRGLLVELIEGLPGTPAGQNARIQIALRLKQRVATDPSLQRRK
jgi:hypothetical protein